MDDLKSREAVLTASRSYYAHLSYYIDLLTQRDQHAIKATKRELEFIEFAFHNHSTHEIKKVLDIACGNGRHMVGLAHHGYHCTGQDYSPEQVQLAQGNARREGVSVKIVQGDSTSLNYEEEFDAVLALYLFFLLPDDDSILKCMREIHRSLKSGGILVCNISNPFHEGEDWFSLKTIHQGYYFNETRVPDMRYISIDRIQDFDAIQGIAWWQETHIIEDSDGVHIFHDRERLRLLTYWDIFHYLRVAGFKEIKCYPDWEINSQRKTKAEMLIFVSRKD